MLEMWREGAHRAGSAASFRCARRLLKVPDGISRAFWHGSSDFTGQPSVSDDSGRRKHQARSCVKRPFPSLSGWQGPAAELLRIFLVKILSMRAAMAFRKTLILASTQEPVFKTAPQELLKMVSVVSRGHILPRGRRSREPLIRASRDGPGYSGKTKRVRGRLRPVSLIWDRTCSPL